MGVMGLLHRLVVAVERLAAVQSGLYLDVHKSNEAQRASEARSVAALGQLNEGYAEHVRQCRAWQADVARQLRDAIPDAAPEQTRRTH